MNKQKTSKGKGIGWTDYTCNIVSGCQHDCMWLMPDEQWAGCYAESVAGGVASAAYPHGFQHHYWYPERLEEPSKIKAPARIFIDSMGDLMGRWVPEDQIMQVFGMMKANPQHIFQLLTKNAPRLLSFGERIPHNCWVGVSVPPTRFMGKRLNESQQIAMLRVSLTVLSKIQRLRWMSFEPLSWDVAPIVRQAGTPLDWAVIGAASKGSTLYQPDPTHVQNLLDVLDAKDVPVYLKENLEWQPRREEFPS